MLLFISLISFVAIHSAPNSFLSGGELNPNMTPEAIDKLKSIYGADKPLHIQYVDWLKSIIHFDFGISFVSGKDVSESIVERLGLTLFLNVATLFSVFALSLYLGIKSALNLNSKIDFFIRQFSLLSFSMPSFYLALVLLLFFSVELEWFPLAGLHSLEEKEGLSNYIDMLWHLFLPLGVMIFVSLGTMIIYIRSLTLEILKSDYYFFALSRDIPKKKLLFDYIVPNLLPPLITLLGLSVPSLIGGSVILESIFGLEGMGQLFYMSALSRDYPVIMGILMISAFLTLIGNMLADMMLMKLNPYMKR